MPVNPVIGTLGRPLRLAVIGGAAGAFIGPLHRIAARMDGLFEIVAGVLSSNPEKSVAAGGAIGLSPERAYPDMASLLAAEKRRDDAIDAVAIMTPNDSHHAYAMAAMDAGYHVICDKPITNTVADAEALVAKSKSTRRVFCLTHNYSGYPLVRQARAMVAAGEIGDLRLVQVEYVQGGKANESKPDDPQAHRGWKFNPEISGPSLVLGDIGTHAHHLLRFITGVEVEQLAAEVGAIVPGRRVHDFAGALLRLEGGARGVFWVTQAAAGVENSLRIRVSGNRGSLEWWQEIPQRLHFYPLGSPAQIRTPNGPGSYPQSTRVCRVAAGHPEGFPEAFANIYADAAEAIACRIAGKEPDPAALWFPTAADGLMGMRFTFACLESAEAGGAWTRV
ncbi:MAG: Gfo/Idh/MocA family oxidoreductase [Gammaproteobacteria bacterium]|nr:Gfo/Idh/MocA family oxidoreductase [Gammaproteobacteria bacterium]